MQPIPIYLMSLFSGQYYTSQGDYDIDGMLMYACTHQTAEYLIITQYFLSKLQVDVKDANETLKC